MAVKDATHGLLVDATSPATSLDSTPDKDAPEMTASWTRLSAPGGVQDLYVGTRLTTNLASWVKIVCLVGLLVLVYKALHEERDAYQTVLTNSGLGLRNGIQPSDQGRGMFSLPGEEAGGDEKWVNIMKRYGSEEVNVHNISSVCSPGVWQPLTSTVAGSNRYGGEEDLMNADIVVSHCSEDLGWLESSIEDLRWCSAGGVNVANIYIYSKCGNNATGMPAGASLMVLPNVGRNAHTYAYHLSQTHPDGIQPLTLFLKDTYHVNNRRGKELEILRLCRMVNVARKNGMGFGCGMAPRMFKYIGQPYRGIGPDGELKRDAPKKIHSKPMIILNYNAGRNVRSSAWHIPSLVGEFTMDKYMPYTNSEQTRIPFNSRIRPLRKWAKHSKVIPPKAMDQMFGRTLLPVCYGGQFAVLKENIERIGPVGFAALRDALTRGDNIEEVHFAERLWAALLTSRPLWPQFDRIEKRLISLAGVVAQERTDPSLNGMLIDCVPWPEEPRYRRRRATRRLAFNIEG